MDNIFSLTAPLPENSISVLEASAGTGKTYAISALTTRFIAEGIKIPEILVVTFTRSAAGELRSRIHERISTTIEALEIFKATGKQPDDEVYQLLCEGDVDLTLHRLNTALGDLDLATIATIHEYSSKMLDELGMLVDHDRSSKFQDQLDGLISEVTTDLYISQWKDKSPKAYRRAVQIGKGVCTNQSAKILADSDIERDFANAVREEFQIRKRRNHVHDYDDMVARLADSLSDPVTGPEAADVLSKRFKVVLVDEFQDTDPQQWSIIENAFGEKRSTVILIGDPKQAIYRFRGGDVETYLKAKNSADQTFTMNTNYRSDEAVVDGILELFGSSNLGTENSVIEIPKVSANHKAGRILYEDKPLARPVVIRKINIRPNSWVSTARKHIGTDLIDLVRGWTNPESKWRLSDSGETRAITCGDIAILAETNSRGLQLADLLRNANIPAVFSGSDSVFASAAATDWQTVLTALVSGEVAAFGRAALTSFFGLSSVEFADANIRDQVFSKLRIAANQLRDTGIVAAFEYLLGDHESFTRLLSQPDGLRTYTDIQHLAELLADAERTQLLSPSGLLEWLTNQIKTGGSNSEDPRRLETDQKTITIATIHQAKGLEFPIVLLPQATDYSPRPIDEDGFSTGHQGDDRVVDLAPTSARKRVYEAENAAEKLRQFYVACTRASSLLIMWHCPSKRNFEYSSLHRLLSLPPEEKTPAIFYPANAPMRELSKVRIIDITERVLNRKKTSTDFELPPAPEHEIRHFTREIDRTWKRTSYSGLTAQLHGFSSTDISAEVDEPELEEITPAETSGENSKLKSSLADLPGGTNFGTLVHHILEVSDPAAGKDQMIAEAEDGLAKYPIADVDATTLGSGLYEVVNTPLGDLAEGASLAEIGRSNRLAELDFELPLGGETWATLSALAKLIDRYPTEVFAGYGQELAQSPAGPQELHGFLTGSIDAVLRHNDRYLVVDYKTNRIPLPEDIELTADKYSPQNMENMMRQSHYPLQALLYQVALHRFLSWRLPGYDPEKHLGPAGYLFVRGMAGAETPTVDGMPYGVFIWHTPVELVLSASKILDGEILNGGASDE